MDSDIYGILINEKLPYIKDLLSPYIATQNIRLPEIHNYFPFYKVIEMSEQRQFFQVPDQHEFDGIPFAGVFEPATLHHIKTSFKFRDDDLLLVTYPKSGNYVPLFIFSI